MTLDKITIVIQPEVEIWVPGTPEPWPKKEVRTVWSKNKKPIPVLYERDYRTRTNPITKKVEKYDRGYISRFKAKMKTVAQIEANQTGFYVKDPGAVGIYTIVEKPKPPSNKRSYPTVRPDGDNYFYLVHNVLEGVLYDDDKQIVDYIEFKRWAIGEPGVRIKFWRVGHEAKTTQTDCLSDLQGEEVF